MIYEIKPSNVASMLYVTTPEGFVVCCFDNNEAYHEGNMSGDGKLWWESLPLEVRAAVNKQFGIVFSLPYNQRDDFLKSSVPFLVEAME